MRTVVSMAMGKEGGGVFVFLNDVHNIWTRKGEALIQKCRSVKKLLRIEICLKSALAAWLPSFYSNAECENWILKKSNSLDFGHLKAESHPVPLC